MGLTQIQHREELGYLLICSGNPGLETQQFNAGLDGLATRHP
jgi:hypothetical protein